MWRSLRFLMLATLPILASSGCGQQAIDLSKWTSSKSGSSRVTLKRVPLKLKFGPIGAAIEVDLSELKNLALDAREILGQVIIGTSGANPPSVKAPVLTVINKRNNKFTYFEISDNVKEVRLKTEQSGSVELILKNKNPLQIELWVDTANDIDLAVEFKDSASDQ